MQFFTNQYVLFAIAAVCVITAYIAGVLLFKRNAVQARTQRMIGQSTLAKETAGRSMMGERLEEMLSALGVNMEEQKRKLYIPLGRAGIASPDAYVYLILFQYVIQPLLLIIGILLLYKWTVFADHLSTDALLFLISGMIMLLIGAMGTRLYLSNARAKREKRLVRSFPDAIDLLLVCVESGLSLDTALAKVCKELRRAHPDITTELERTRLELNILNDRVQALQNLSDRTNTAGFRSLVSALMQSEKFGTSLSDTLRVLSEDFRASRLLLAENKAARIPALITLPLILFILPAFMLLIMAPPFIKISQLGGIMGGTR